MANNRILKMITESAPEVQILKEAYDPAKPRTIKFKGIFLVSEKKNGNNRIYPYEELSREVERFKTEMIRVIAFQPDGTIIDRYGTYDDYLNWLAEQKAL